MVGLQLSIPLMVSSHRKGPIFARTYQHHVPGMLGLVSYFKKDVNVWASVVAVVVRPARLVSGMKFWHKYAVTVV